MSLLDMITKASSDADSLVNPTKYPIILNSESIFSKLKLENEVSGENSLINRVTGWEISNRDAEIIELGNRFSKKLRRKLKNPKSFNSDGFLGILNPFLEKIGAKSGVRLDFDSTNPSYTTLMLENFGVFLGRSVVDLIVETCVVFELWELLKTLVLQGLVGPLSSVDLIEKLVQNKRADLLCLCIKHIANLRSSDLLLILRYFLSPSNGDQSLITVRKEWESETVLAIEKATKLIPQKKSHSSLKQQKSSSTAKNASILLAIAYDGFSASELCLHYLFASSHNGLELLSAISRLESSEMLSLIRYFGKWLRKYSSIPEAVPCSMASEVGSKACNWVPSLESVVRSLGLVLDEHFSYLVLYSEFHEELKSIEKLVQSFTSEARLSCSVANVIEIMRLNIETKSSV